MPVAENRASYWQASEQIDLADSAGGSDVLDDDQHGHIPVGPGNDISGCGIPARKFDRETGPVVIFGVAGDLAVGGADLRTEPALQRVYPAIYSL